MILTKDLLMRIWLVGLVLVAMSGCNQRSDKELLAEASALQQLALQQFYDDLESEKPEWTIRASISPEDCDHVLMVQYRDELNFSESTAYCMAIFENASEMRLVAPWIDGYIRIHKANLLTDKVETVLKDSITTRGR